jgi:hypothetical protein
MNAKKQLEEAGYPHDFLAKTAFGWLRIRCGTPFSIKATITLRCKPGLQLKRGQMTQWTGTLDGPLENHVLWRWIGPDMRVKGKNWLLRAWLLLPTFESSDNGLDWAPSAWPGFSLLPLSYLPDSQDVLPLVKPFAPEQLHYVRSVS